VPWQLSTVAWIPKQGKQSSCLDDRRGIHLLDHGAKAYFGALHLDVKEALEHQWDPMEWGAIRARSAVHAISIEYELIARALRAGVSFCLYLGDATKAFDKFSRPRACRALRRLAGKRESVRRLIQRHRRSVFCIHRGKTRRFVRMRRGVLQGDPNGPTMFVPGCHEYGRALKMSKSPADASAVTASMVEPLGSSETAVEVDLSSSFYMDDQAEFMVVDSVEDVRRQLLPVFHQQAGWGIETNFGKSVLLPKFVGRRSRRRLK